jgi:MurNAc alpha-1-phosphate uridylyltransferase
MVLAAGLGRRMRPLTDNTPKPLIQVAGKALIDHVLERVKDAGIKKAVVNVHHLADMVEQHLSGTKSPKISISDEREELLETAGGIKKALPLIGDEPFLIFNSDSLWVEHRTPGVPSAIRQFLDDWKPEKMDVLLMLVEPESAVGFDGPGDYFMEYNNQLTRRSYSVHAPYIYAGVAVAKPCLFTDLRRGEVSLTEVFDKAQSKYRLYGSILRAPWLHIGTPDSITAAEEFIKSREEKE